MSSSCVAKHRFASVFEVFFEENLFSSSKGNPITLRTRKKGFPQRKLQTQRRSGESLRSFFGHVGQQQPDLLKVPHG